MVMVMLSLSTLFVKLWPFMFVLEKRFWTSDGVVKKYLIKRIPNKSKHRPKNFGIEPP